MKGHSTSPASGWGCDQLLGEPERNTEPTLNVHKVCCPRKGSSRKKGRVGSGWASRPGEHSREMGGSSGQVWETQVENCPATSLGL
jgi:hypothetical protein